MNDCVHCSASSSPVVNNSSSTLCLASSRLHIFLLLISSCCPAVAAASKCSLWYLVPSSHVSLFSRSPCVCMLEDISVCESTHRPKSGGIQSLRLLYAFPTKTQQEAAERERGEAERACQVGNNSESMIPRDGMLFFLGRPLGFVGGIRQPACIT